MQEEQQIPSEQETPEVPQEQGSDAPPQDTERPKLKSRTFKDKFKEKGKQEDEKNKPPMNMEETIEFYEKNLPFMKMQDEYEELVYRFNERKVKNLELQVREVEAIGFLAQWKNQQDDAHRRYEEEQKMKEAWEKMTPEEREEYKKKAQASLKIMDMQAKGEVKYDGTNAHQIMEFVTGEPHEPIVVDDPTGKISFQVPTADGQLNELSMVPGQTLARAEDGNFMVIA